ncbi:MAG: hypothetical protein Q9227_000177 [Pyrenula ochraceoflavens]
MTLPEWFLYPRPFRRPRPKSSSDTRIICCPRYAHNDYPIEYRTVFYPSGREARGYPSTGGLLLLPFDIAVAQHLNLPRLSPSRRAQNVTDEDIFCKRLRLLGAKWWRSDHDHAEKLIGFTEATEEEKKRIIVGWPSNGHGVWIMRMHNEGPRPRDYGKLRMCLNMDERCALLDSWGAEFYDDPKNVEKAQTWSLHHKPNSRLSPKTFHPSTGEYVCGD